ncbi:manganese-dependent inorganic pyrophosphatase [Patescibacteria group bacterium]|nr:manganese-dependent inorganic pyrophosphatase [Patescibacteria group bacterium]
MKIHITSHKSPDLDATVAAISYAYLKNKLDPANEYIAVSAGELNKETKFILEKFNLSEPAILENIKGLNIILVDHNESSQIQEGHEEANIIEVVDHHKINFNFNAPIFFESKPWGSTCSIIARKYCENSIEKPKNLASAMLAAILVDTVITKSPTCTETDKKIINKLSNIAGIEDWKEFGMDIFKVRSSVSKYEAIDIIKNDFKDFEFGEYKFGIGQIETVDLHEIEPREEELLIEMTKLKEENNYHTVILFLTDIINEGSKFLVITSDQAKVEQALKSKLIDSKVYIKDIMSRKKQVVPMLMEIF